MILRPKTTLTKLAAVTVSSVMAFSVVSLSQSARAASAQECAAGVQTDIRSIFEPNHKVAANFKEFFGDQFFSYRLAAAEVLQRVNLMPRSIANPKAKEILSAIRDNAPERINMAELDEWRSFLGSVQSQSDLARRLKLAAHYDSRAEIPKSLGGAIKIELEKPAPAPEKSGGIFGLFKSSPKTEAPTTTSLDKIEYLNVEQFLSYLERFSPDQRLAKLEALDRIEYFAHVEVFQILAEFPVAEQRSIFEKLKHKIVGRIDFFDESFFENLRDTKTKEVMIDTTILAHELKTSASSYSVLEIMHIMDALDLNSIDRAEILSSGRDFTKIYQGISEFEKLDSMTSDFVLKSLLSKSHSLAQAEAAVDLLIKKSTSRHAQEDLHTAFTLWVSDSAFAAAYKLGLILKKADHTPESLISDLSQFVANEKYSPAEALQILRYLQGDSFLPLKTAQYPEKSLLHLRDLLRTLTAADRPNDPTGTKGWTATDLVFFDVSFDLDLAVKAIEKMQGKSQSAEMSEALKAEFWRIAQAAKLRHIGPADLTPGKEKRGPPLARNVSPERMLTALRQFVLEKSDAAKP